MRKIVEQKKQLRKSVRYSLAEMTKSGMRSESLWLCEALKQILDEFSQQLSAKKSLVIASFAGLSFEPDLLGLHLLLPEHEFVYPRCKAEGEMNFHKVTDVSRELIKGYYGIREPRDLADTKVLHDEVDVYLVPAFAYSSNGARLGKGGGYYDRVLDSIEDKLVIGVGFSVQLVEEIPEESHDVRVGQVLIAKS